MNELQVITVGGFWAAQIIGHLRPRDRLVVFTFPAFEGHRLLSARPSSNSSGRQSFRPAHRLIWRWRLPASQHSLPPEEGHVGRHFMPRARLMPEFTGPLTYQHISHCAVCIWFSLYAGIGLFPVSTNAVQSTTSHQSGGN